MPKSALLGSTAAPPPNRPADQPKRSHHAFRGTPPPATFSLAELPDDALLTEFEVAAVARLSTNTLAAWRLRGKRRDHRLPWIAITGGFIRYKAADVRQFLAAGEQRRPRRKSVASNTDAARSTPPRRRHARPRTNTDLAVDEAAR